MLSPRIEGIADTKDGNTIETLAPKSEKEIANEKLAKEINKASLSSSDDVDINVSTSKNKLSSKNLTNTMFPIHEEIDELYENILKEKGSVKELDFVTAYMSKYDCNNMAQALKSFNRTKSIKEGNWTPQKEAQYIGSTVVKMVISATDSSAYASEKFELSNEIMSELGMNIGEFNPDLPPKELKKVIAQYEKQWGSKDTKWKKLVRQQEVSQVPQALPPLIRDIEGTSSID